VDKDIVTLQVAMNNRLIPDCEDTVASLPVGRDCRSHNGALFVVSASNRRRPKERHPLTIQIACAVNEQPKVPNISVSVLPSFQLPIISSYCCMDDFSATAACAKTNSFTATLVTPSIFALHFVRNVPPPPMICSEDFFEDQ
jgi:hypothetical protein